jgi:hypothetical protein
MITTRKPGACYRRALATVVGVLVVASVVGCSGKASQKAPGPDGGQIKGAPCSTKCCCRVEDGYYRRHDCTSEQDCAAAGGECLPAETPRCRH